MNDFIKKFVKVTVKLIGIFKE